MPIERLSKPISEYIANFDLQAIGLRDGKLRLTCNPQGYTAAWWCRAQDAQRRLAAARANGGDVLIAAAKEGIGVTEHSIVLWRVSASLARIRDALERAAGEGTVRFFNREYRRRRHGRSEYGRPREICGASRLSASRGHRLRIESRQAANVHLSATRPQDHPALVLVLHGCT